LHRWFARPPRKHAPHLRPAEAALLGLLEAGGTWSSSGRRRNRATMVPEAMMSK
jgi:hypothetical protein